MFRNLIVAVLMLLLAGCAQPMTTTQKGTAVGAGIGAAVGAGIGQAMGKDTRSTLIGAGIGALVGGVAGNQVGAYMDAQEQQLRQEMAAVEGASVQRNANTLTLTFKSNLLFDVDSAAMKPGAHDEMFRVAKVLNDYPQTTLLVAGHTDSTGTEAYNQTLSERRAEVVKNSLASSGVNPARIRTIGYGESRPVAGNDTESGRQLNRRVEITIEPIQG